MIYVDASVALAALLEERRRPHDSFWNARCVASRLTDLEVRVRFPERLRERGHASTDLERLLARIEYMEITTQTVELLYREPTSALRTLDAIHLATLDFFNRELGHAALATYDRRLATAAHAMGFQVIVP